MQLCPQGTVGEHNRLEHTFAIEHQSKSLTPGAILMKLHHVHVHVLVKKNLCFDIFS